MSEIHFFPHNDVELLLMVCLFSQVNINVSYLFHWHRLQLFTVVGHPTRKHRNKQLTMHFSIWNWWLRKPQLKSEENGFLKSLKQSLHSSVILCQGPGATVFLAYFPSEVGWLILDESSFTKTCVVYVVPSNRPPSFRYFSAMNTAMKEISTECIDKNVSLPPL